jgi:transcriptional regulator with XRE-family HTH domain
MHWGLTHRALAKLLNVDPGSLSRWETDERRPDRRSREVIERFLAAPGLVPRDGTVIGPLAEYSSP